MARVGGCPTADDADYLNNINNLGYDTLAKRWVQGATPSTKIAPSFERAPPLVCAR
jgi:hypothetical protein